MKSAAFTLAALLCAISGAAAQAGKGSKPAPGSKKTVDAGFTEVQFHRVYLKNGNFIDGELLRDSAKEVVLAVRRGEMAIRRDQIDRVERMKVRTLNEPTEVVEPPEPAAPTDEAAPKAKPEAPPGAPDVAPPSVMKEQSPPELRKRVDELVGIWTASRGEQPSGLQGELEGMGKEVVPYLAALLESRAASVPVKAFCGAIGSMKDERAIPSLGRLMTSKSNDDRLACVGALGQIGGRTVVPPLVFALADDWPEVWRKSSQSLVALGQSDASLGIAKAVATAMKTAKEKLSYAQTLGGLGGNDARQALLALLKTGDTDGKLAALQGLNQIGNKDDGEAIQELLQIKDRTVRLQACNVLARMKYRQAVPDIIDLLDEEDEGLVNTAMTSLRAITGQRFAADPGRWKAWWESVGSKKEDKDEEKEK